jgi:hypothetical protein
VLAREVRKLGERAEFDDDGVGECVDRRHASYQVTSPAPARLFATRASTNNKSDRRFK